MVADAHPGPGPAFLIYFHIALCCVSLVYVSQFYGEFHIAFDENHVYQAAAAVALCALISPFFTLARFSFGYYVGFYLYTSVVGFIWLSFFTPFNYDQQTARFSAVLSIIALLLPGLMIRSPIRQIYVISAAAVRAPSHRNTFSGCGDNCSGRELQLSDWSESPTSIRSAVISTFQKRLNI